MKIINKLLFFVVATLLSIGQTISQEYRRSLDIRVPFTPDFVTINGRPTVYYELYVTNFSVDSVGMQRLDIIDATDSTVIVSISKHELKKKCARIGVSEKGKENLLAPGATSVIYIEIVLQNDKPNVQLSHRLEIETMRVHEKKSWSIQSTITYLSKKPQLVLGSPLQDGPWAAVYDPSWGTGHRRVIYTVNGKARIPGRFAIDFIKLDNKGRYASRDENVIKNWYGYASNVLAVADGVVASTRDDFFESSTLSQHPKYAADKATGNYISIDLGNNYIAFYEHLKPSSIKVKPKQKVKKGDVIASLGFTGQTTGPHLHFHIANANSSLGAEGAPFVFESFTLLGSYADFENFGKTLWIPVNNSNQLKLNEERPASNSVIMF